MVCGAPPGERLPVPTPSERQAAHESAKALAEVIRRRRDGELPNMGLAELVLHLSARIQTAAADLRPILTGYEKARDVMGREWLVKCERELRIEAALAALDGEKGDGGVPEASDRL